MDDARDDTPRLAARPTNTCQTAERSATPKAIRHELCEAFNNVKGFAFSADEGTDIERMDALRSFAGRCRGVEYRQLSVESTLVGGPRFAAGDVGAEVRKVLQ